MNLGGCCGRWSVEGRRPRRKGRDQVLSVGGEGVTGRREWRRGRSGGQIEYGMGSLICRRVVKQSALGLRGDMRIHGVGILSDERKTIEQTCPIETSPVVPFHNKSFAVQSLLQESSIVRCLSYLARWRISSEGHTSGIYP